MNSSTSTFLLIIALAFPFTLSAYVMGSSNYRVGSDSINFGGAPGSSASYNGEDTLGEIGTGISSSTSYAIGAGYQQMQQSYISISQVSNASFESVNGLSGGQSNSSTTWSVVTDNAAGYTLTVRASTAPALTGSGGASFSDYAPSGADPDYSFSIPATESRFGISPEGSDVVARFKDNGSICNSGGLETSDRCWDGVSMTPMTISQGSGSNHPNGATTTVKYRAAVGTSKIQDSGSYSSTITVTATTL